MHVVYAAKKYQLSSLVTKCGAYLKQSIDVTNAALILDHSNFFAIDTVKDACLAFIALHTSAVLETEAFLKISLSSLIMILALDDLEIDEADLFLHCVTWAESQIAQRSQSTPTSDEMIRDVLEEALFHIRFPTMDATTFTELMRNRSILTDSEMNDVRLYMTSERSLDDNSQYFMATPRNNFWFVALKVSCKLRWVEYRVRTLCTSLVVSNGQRMTHECLQFSHILVAAPLHARSACDGMTVSVNVELPIVNKKSNITEIKDLVVKDSDTRVFQLTASQSVKYVAVPFAYRMPAGRNDAFSYLMRIDIKLDFSPRPQSRTFLSVSALHGKYPEDIAKTHCQYSLLVEPTDEGFEPVEQGKYDHVPLILLGFM